MYLYIRYNLAHGLTEKPIARYVCDDRRRQTNENNKKVADGQVDDEYVCDGTHVRVLGNHNDNEHVADDADHEYDEGEKEQTPIEQVRIEIGEKILLVWPWCCAFD